jgi:hypothetical protein
MAALMHEQFEKYTCRPRLFTFLGPGRYIKINTYFWPPTVPYSVVDPYVFGPPGSGSESRSGSFHYQAKILRITLISTLLLLLCDYLPLKRIYSTFIIIGISLKKFTKKT